MRRPTLFARQVGEMGNWAMVLSDDVDALLGTGELWGYMGGELRMPVAAYLCVVILILMTATSFRPSDAVPLRAILIAAFCWPVTVPVLVWRAWENR
jgi:hypothetical protein